MGQTLVRCDEFVDLSLVLELLLLNHLLQLAHLSLVMALHALNSTEIAHRFLLFLLDIEVLDGLGSQGGLKAVDVIRETVVLDG
jgi:hypothetical protein